MAAKPNRGLRRRRRRRGFFADLWRSSQLSVCWTALAILLCFHLWILRRCYNSCLRTSGHVGLKNWQFIDYPNETQSISRIGVDKGPFGSWREAFNALKEIRRRDIQNEISAPLNAAYRKFRDEPIRLDHLPHPPAWCNRFYDHDSPIDIDLALTRMMGHNFSRIPSDFVRNVSLTVDITTNYTTRFPLRKSATIYVLKDGVLYFDRRSNHPRQCGHQHKIVGFLTFMQATLPLGLPDVAFRFGCLDNPYPPLEGLWTYSSFKEADRGPLAFPDDYFTFERWQRLRPDPAEPAYRDKPLRAAWHGSRTGDKPLHHAYRQGFLETVSVELLENVTSREYFVGRYADGSDDRITASFDKVPISQLLRRSRVLLAIAGHSFASNTLPLLSSNSLVVAQESLPNEIGQDFPTSSWEDHFFFPGTHFLAIPRNMDNAVLQAVLDLVQDRRNDDYFTNMTRLAATVAEAVVDPRLAICYTHRALQLWRSRLELTALELNDHLVPILDFAEVSRSANLTGKQLLKRAFSTRVHSGLLLGLWESILIWWFDFDYNATTYM